MRFLYYPFLFIFTLALPLNADELNIKEFLIEAKSTCLSLGFPIGTKGNANCVLNLVKIQKDKRIKYHQHKEKIISVLEKNR